MSSRAELKHVFRDRLGALMSIDDAKLELWLNSICERYPAMRNWDFSWKNKMASAMGGNALAMAAEVMVSAANSQKLDSPVAYTESRAQQAFAMVCFYNLIGRSVEIGRRRTGLALPKYSHANRFSAFSA
jgi:hypothetical protein